MMLASAWLLSISAVDTSSSSTGSLWTTVPGILVAALGLIGMLAGAVGYARGSFAKAQITALRGDRDDLTGRTQRLERELSETTQKLEAETTARKTLEAVVTGKQELAQVIAALNAHDARAAHMERLLEAVAEKLGVPHDER